MGLSTSRISKIISSLKHKNFIEVEILRNEETKEIEKRIITPCEIGYRRKQPYPIAENNERYRQKQLDSIAENSSTLWAETPIPIVENCQDNNTINKTSNNKTINKELMCILDEYFKQLWKLYPKKKGLGSISYTQKQKLYKIGFEEMSRAVKRYVDEQKELGTELKFYKMGSTFFNSGYVDYLDCNCDPKNLYSTIPRADTEFKDCGDSEFLTIEEALELRKRRKDC